MSTSKKPSPALLATISGAALVVLLVFMFSLSRNETPEPSATITPTASGSSTPPSTTAAPTASTASATPSPSATPTPLVTPSPTEGAITIPESAKSFLANFYTAYKQQDRERLSSLFTPDVSSDDQSLHATLFTGKDLNGNPGGPTLFSTNSAAEWVTEYTLLGSAPQGVNWTVTIREKRASANSNATGTFTTLIRLVPAPSGQGTWLIDAYVHAGSADKYNGFFIE